MYPDVIVITGALGNLGWKYMQHLAQNCRGGILYGLDRYLPDEEQRRLLEPIKGDHAPLIKWVDCDLTDPLDERWRKVMSRASAIIHFAAQNPFPEATWNDATASMDMTINTLLAAAESPTLSRYVFASSNHVMGRYKNENIAEGELKVELEPGIGTVWNFNNLALDSTPYAAAKIVGERTCRILGRRFGGEKTFVGIRIGWCQPGKNLPGTLSAVGTPTQKDVAGSGKKDEATERWFKEMWLSNRDFKHLFDCALQADARSWPGSCVIVNGVSANSGMKWSLVEARKWLGYRPVDNVYP